MERQGPPVLQSVECIIAARGVDFGVEGLVVTRSYEDLDRFTLTHRSSGYAPCPDLTWDTPEDAARAGLRVAAVADWTRSKEDLAGDEDVARVFRELIEEHRP